MPWCIHCKPGLYEKERTFGTGWGVPVEMKDVEFDVPLRAQGDVLGLVGAEVILVSAESDRYLK